MKGNSAVLGMDLMTVNAIVFILVGLILASLVTTKEILRHFEAVKTQGQQDAVTPDIAEMAKVFFTLNNQGEAVIGYQGESGSMKTIVDYKALLLQLDTDAPHFIYLKADARYPYGDIGALMMDASARRIQIYMVAEHD